MEYGGEPRELQIHDPFQLPDELELEHEIKRPRWWYAQQLRLAGASWTEIAEALGYSNAYTVQNSVKKALDAAGMTRQSAEELIALELERLDMLQLVVWRRARNGDLKSIDAILKIMSQRARYLGLENREYEDERPDSATIIIGGDSADYVAALKASQHRVKKPIEGELA